MLRIPFALLGNLWRLIAYLLSMVRYQLSRLPRRGKALYVRVDLDADPPMAHTGWKRLLSKKPSLWQLRRDFKRIQEDPEVAGVILKVREPGMGITRQADIVDQIEDLRRAGKHVVVQMQQASTRDLVLASAAEDVLLTPAGRFYTFGLRFEQLFVKPMLDRLGVKGQFIHIGGFKTATHMFHKEGMTTAQRGMMQGLYDGLSGHIVDTVASRRGVEPDAVRQALAEAPIDTRRARQLGLIDGEAFEHEVLDWIAESRGRRGGLVARSMTKHLSSKPTYRWRPLRSRGGVVAMMDLSGQIVMSGGGGLGGGGNLAAADVVPALRKLGKNPMVKGLLLHINSPGGSALASDLMWQEIRRLGKRMPVVCYLSDVAASGGYYLAVAGDRIICRETTVTGSIGVLMGKFSVQEAAARAGVNTEAIYEDENTKFMSLWHELPDSVLENLREDARSFYRRFLDRVGQSRNIPRRRLHRYARGRVYLGDEALHRGLVDKLGGLDDAIEELLGMCELDERDTTFLFVEHRKQSARDVLTAQAHAAWTPPTILQELMEPARHVELMMQESMLAMSPVRVRWE